MCTIIFFIQIVTRSRFRGEESEDDKAKKYILEDVDQDGFEKIFINTEIGKL